MNGTRTGIAFVAILVVTIGAARADDDTAHPGPGGRSDLAKVAATDDAFVARVRAAIADHDLGYFEKTLVDWDGARKRTQRLTLFQIRECFGRPVKSIALERLIPDPDAPLVPDGYRTNRPVTHLLRIAFEEAHAPGETPACVFMLSKDPNTTFRMALVLPKDAAPK